MNSSAPKFRSDLECRPQETANGTALVVKDPISGEFFRFQEVERFIAEQLDGDNSLDVIRLRSERKFEAALAPEALAGFVKSLDDSGLLESRPGAPARRRRKRGRFAGGV